MNKTKLEPCYVVTGTGTVLVQIPDETSRWGFYLTDGEIDWDGGFGWRSWTRVAPDHDDVYPEDRERLQWIIDEAMETTDDN